MCINNKRSITGGTGMGDTRYLNGKGRRNYLVCMVIMYAMILFYVLKIVIGGGEFGLCGGDAAGRYKC